MGTLKIVLVGNAECGKSTLIDAYTKQDFHSVHYSTGSDVYLADIQVAGKTIPVAIYLKTNREHWSSEQDLEIAPAVNYYGTNVFIMCYSCVDESSLENIHEHWLEEVQNEAGVGVPIVLVGNKLDLREDWPKDYVSETKAHEMMLKIGAEAHVQCSALNKIRGVGGADNVDEVFQLAIKSGLQHMKVSYVDEVFKLEKVLHSVDCSTGKFLILIVLILSSQFASSALWFKAKIT